MALAVGCCLCAHTVQTKLLQCAQCCQHRQDEGHRALFAVWVFECLQFTIQTLLKKKKRRNDKIKPKLRWGQGGPLGVKVNFATNTNVTRAESCTLIFPMKAQGFVVLWCGEAHSFLQPFMKTKYNREIRLSPILWKECN